MSQAWVTGSKTKLQAQLDGEKVDGWPEPCEHCGAQYKRTPAGRWYICHLEGDAPPYFRRTSEPQRVGGLIPPPKEKDAA